MRKLAVCAGISTLALLTASSAYAQSSAGNAPEEIVVTAQRRAERLQDVPLAIIAHSGAQLEQAAISNIRDLTSLAPGVSFAGAGNNTAPSIRGVFSAQSDPGNDGNVAIYIDGIYQASQLGNAVDFPDLDRIEILKGPQGTLFGRNSAGGAVRIFTVAPNMNEMKGQLTVGYGSFNEYVAKGYFTGPVIENKLAMSISGGIQRSDGYNYDVVNRRDNGGTSSDVLRLKFLFTPTDNLRIDVFSTYNRRKDNNIMAYAVAGGNTSARRNYPGVIIPTERFEYTSTNLPELETMRYEVGAKITYETGWGSFSNLTAWSHTHNYYWSDGDLTVPDGNSYPAIQRASDIQNEFLFSSKKFGPFQFTAGTFYYGSTGRYDPLVVQGDDFGGRFYVWGRQRVDDYSAFADGNIDLTDRITVIGGVRYSSEKRHGNNVFGIDATRPAIIPELGKRIFTSVTPRGSIRYRFTDAGDNVYFTFSQGHKSGGYNISGGQAAAFLPEKVTAYEIGVKSAGSRMVSANLSAFYYKYTNQQVQTINGFTNVTSNAASSRMYGVDGDINARLTDELSIGLSFAYLDAKYSAFPGANVIIPIPNCQCGGVNAVGDLGGTRQPYSPKFAGGLNVHYDKELAVGELNVAANLYYSDGFKWDPQGVIVSPKYASLALSASFTPTDSRFTFGAWGRNLTNAKYYNNVIVTTNASGINYAPRAGGATIKYTY